MNDNHQEKLNRSTMSSSDDFSSFLPSVSLKRRCSSAGFPVSSSSGFVPASRTFFARRISIGQGKSECCNDENDASLMSQRQKLAAVASSKRTSTFDSSSGTVSPQQPRQPITSITPNIFLPILEGTDATNKSSHASIGVTRSQNTKRDHDGDKSKSHDSFSSSPLTGGSFILSRRSVTSSRTVSPFDINNTHCCGAALLIDCEKDNTSFLKDKESSYYDGSIEENCTKKLKRTPLREQETFITNSSSLSYSTTTTPSSRCFSQDLEEIDSDHYFTIHQTRSVIRDANLQEIEQTKGVKIVPPLPSVHPSYIPYHASQDRKHVQDDTVEQLLGRFSMNILLEDDTRHTIDFESGVESINGIRTPNRPKPQTDRMMEGIFRKTKLHKDDTTKEAAASMCPSPRIPSNGITFPSSATTATKLLPASSVPQPLYPSQLLLSPPPSSITLQHHTAGASTDKNNKSDHPHK